MCADIPCQSLGRGEGSDRLVPVTERETQRADDYEANRHTYDSPDHLPKNGTSWQMRMVA